MSKTASEYLVEAIYMTKAILDGRATQPVDLARVNLLR
jgi:regulator of sirC expression with transglutaminase-like and TPR domain